ncbi:hypothetical protein [Luteolibacter sp. LG18]|uniref:DUF6916 family protein n=1 Tax=Luteolibacter sp. LG18 TaxID=2819286 RepID=UPI002B2AF5EE|nr:hypothetical protein llg_33410 [Luteolibacter sp. LG18]
MTALESLQHADFAKHEGTAFALPQAGNDFSLILQSARLLGHHHPGATRDAFALVFAHPGNIRIAQGIHHFEHAELGTLHLFITQVSGSPQGSEFEAVFT